MRKRQTQSYVTPALYIGTGRPEPRTDTANGDIAPDRRHGAPSQIRVKPVTEILFPAIQQIKQDRRRHNWNPHAEARHHDSMRIARLKQRKLKLKDMIRKLESELIPDLDA